MSKYVLKFNHYTYAVRGYKLFNLDNEKMEKVVSGYQIPIKPEVLSDIQNEMTEPEPCIEKISTLISNDVGLSSATLKIINSPFYGMNRRISEIKQAVMMLGLNTIQGLVTALLLKQSFKGDACISLERFWDDASDIANAMTFIGSKIKNEIPVDMLYTIGLFHDCGIPLLAIKYDDYKEVLIEANRLNDNTIKLEETHYGTNHAIMGYYIASSWHLPKGICNLILQHHEKDYLAHIKDPEMQLTYSALKMAENMLERVKRYNTSPDWEDLESSVLEIIGISHTDYIDLEDDFSEMFNH